MESEAISRHDSGYGSLDLDQDKTIQQLNSEEASTLALRIAALEAELASLRIDRIAPAPESARPAQSTSKPGRVLTGTVVARQTLAGERERVS